MRGLLTLFLAGIFSYTQGQQAMFDALLFKNGNEVMVENTLSFDAQSIAYAKLGGDSLQGKLEITQIISDSTKIVDYQKFTLSTPIFTRSTIADFLDRQRYSLAPGKYTMEIVLQDLVRKSSPVQFSQPLLVPEFTTPSISSIEFLAAIQPSDGNSYYHKAGYKTEPLISDYFSPELDKIIAYVELYNTELEFGKGGKFVTRSFIQNSETGAILDEMVQFSRHTAETVIPLLKTFNINELPSGNFDFVIEIRNAENLLVFGKKRKFSRNNPEKSVIDYNKLITTATFVADLQSLDTIRQYIEYLHPIASKMDKQLIRNQEEHLPELDDCKRFFYGFWLKRNSNNPSISWAQYKQLVHMANSNFGNKVNPGYQTDRGRIFLKYGPPNSRMEQPSEPEAVPYEIWHYYRLGKYTNRKFVFYNPDIVTNNFLVLHSDVPGEVQNSSWLQELYKKSSNSSWSRNAEQTSTPFGRRALELFNNPR
ncbi:MAG: GWxTD domain-containing protein [Luteibaculaceae bacterium]